MFVQEVKTQVIKVKSGESDGHKHASHRTVFHDILQSKLPPDELSVERLKHEAASVTGAGIDTTKTTLALATYHILANPEVYARLKKDLEEAIPDAATIPPVVELEKIEYLSAVIQEALRMSYGISQRLSRINPHETIEYGGYCIPPNSRFSMSTYMMHRDPRVFPQPDEFRPDRWLGQAIAYNGKPLTKYLVPFSRGPRMCLGMNFANAELYIGLATVFRRLNLELFQTQRDAVDMAADFFVPIPAQDTKGVRVVVR